MTILRADYLGAPKYIKAMLAGHKVGCAGAIFYRTFGHGKEAATKMGRSKKFSHIPIHLASFDGTHKYPVSKYLSQIKKDAKEIEAIAKRFPDTKFQISPFCEHMHKASVMTPIFEEIEQIAPSCGLINSIMFGHGGDEIPWITTEIHLEKFILKKPKNKSYIVTADGFGGNGSGDFSDTNIQKLMEFYSDAEQFGWWNFENNGKYSHDDESSVNKRKNWPNVHYIKGHWMQLKPREGSITWDKNNLYKPFADDHDGPQAKDSLAMCILHNTNAPYVHVFDVNKKVIDKMTRMLPDHTGNPKGARYYSKLYAYQIGNIAEKNTGSRLVCIDGLPYTDVDLRSSFR